MRPWSPDSTAHPHPISTFQPTPPHPTHTPHTHAVAPHTPTPPHSPLQAKRLAPGPFNLPSLKKEHGGLDPDLLIVPRGGAVWGGPKADQATLTAAAHASAAPALLAKKAEARAAAAAARLAEEEAQRSAAELAARVAEARKRAAVIAAEATAADRVAHAQVAAHFPALGSDEEQRLAASRSDLGGLGGASLGNGAFVGSLGGYPPLPHPTPPYPTLPPPTRPPPTPPYRAWL